MSLTGALDAFPLPEILRLLARSQKSGALQIDAADLHGRIYLTDGWLTYATTRRDEDLVEDLVGAGLIDSQDWVLVERREKDVIEVLRDGVETAQLEALVGDQVAEVIFRLLRRPDGSFEFRDGAPARFATGILLDVDGSISEAERRAAQWAAIEKVIPGVEFHLRMAPELPDSDDITLSARSWMVLSAMQGESTIEEVARRLGWTDFQVGQLMADLVRAGLLSITDLPPSASYGYGEETGFEVIRSVTGEKDEDLFRSALSEVVGTDPSGEARRAELKDSGE